MTFYLYMTISRPGFTARHLSTVGWSDPPSDQEQREALERMKATLRHRLDNLPGRYQLDLLELEVVNDKGRHSWGKWKTFDEVSLEGAGDEGPDF